MVQDGRKERDGDGASASGHTLIAVMRPGGDYSLSEMGALLRGGSGGEQSHVMLRKHRSVELATLLQ